MFSSHLHLGLPSGLFLSCVPTKTLYACHISHARYMARPSHPPWFHHPNNIWRSVQFTTVFQGTVLESGWDKLTLNSRSLGGDLNAGPQGYVAKMLTTTTRRSVPQSYGENVQRVWVTIRNLVIRSMDLWHAVSCNANCLSLLSRPSNWLKQLGHVTAPQCYQPAIMNHLPAIVFI